jgi:hypothetical protein
VETAQTIGRRLNHHLGAAYDVVALGQPGWGPREELTALRASGRMLEPDHVVLLFLPFNDVRNSSPVLHERVSGGRDLDHLRPGWTNLRPALLWFESSTLNQLVAHRLARFREGSPDFVPLDYLVYQDPPDAEWEAAWKEAEALLLAMRDVARELGASFLLVSASTPHGVLGREEGLQQLLAAYPAMEGRSWDLDLPNRQLADFAETNGIPFLSLEPTFREETRRGASLHFAYDGHWNAAGHDLAGRLVAGWLRRRSISRSG